MTDTYAPARVEPTIEGQVAGREPSSLVDDPRTPEAPVPPAAYVAPDARAAAPQPRGVEDQLARIEDKTARIEEKYARSEAVLQRVGDKVDAATGRMGEVALQSDLKAVRAELHTVAARVRRLPGLNALVATAIVTALLSAAITVAVLKYGIPGLLPQ